MIQNVAMRDPWLYLALYDRRVVVRVHVDTGILERVAGDPSGLESPFDEVAEEGVPALDAELYDLFDIAVGREGEVFILENRGCVRRIEVGGDITTHAGTCGDTGSSPDGVVASGSALGPSRAIAADQHGTLYISEPGTNSIRIVYAEP